MSYGKEANLWLTLPSWDQEGLKLKIMIFYKHNRATALIKKTCVTPQVKADGHHDDSDKYDHLRGNAGSCISWGYIDLALWA